MSTGRSLHKPFNASLGSVSPFSGLPTLLSPSCFLEGYNTSPGELSAAATSRRHFVVSCLQGTVCSVYVWPLSKYCTLSLNTAKRERENEKQNQTSLSSSLHCLCSHRLLLFLSSWQHTSVTNTQSTGQKKDKNDVAQLLACVFLSSGRWADIPLVVIDGGCASSLMNKNTFLYSIKVLIYSVFFVFFCLQQLS